MLLCTALAERECVCVHVHQIDDADEEDGCDVADEDAQLEELAVIDDDDNE